VTRIALLGKLIRRQPRAATSGDHGLRAGGGTPDRSAVIAVAFQQRAKPRQMMVVVLSHEKGQVDEAHWSSEPRMSRGSFQV
jgi:hypothetical protein